MSQPATFTATIAIVGVNAYVSVPASITQFFGRRGYVPVMVGIRDRSFPSTLVPVGGGAHRLYINVPMLRCASAKVGDRITIGLRFDPRSRMPRCPRALKVAIDADAARSARWKALTPSRRKEILRYLGFAKTEETRSRTIARVLAILDSPSGGVLSGIKIQPRKPRSKS